MTLKNILVATDFSEASESAVSIGRQLAHAFGANLHVLHVVGSVVAGAIGVEGYTFDFTALQREIEEAARKQLDAVVTEEDRRTLAARAIMLTSSTPAQSIVSYAKQANIDLVVVGTHGRGGMAHVFMGSVAERVVRTAPCPVLTARQSGQEPVPPDLHEAAAHV